MGDFDVIDSEDLGLTVLPHMRSFPCYDEAKEKIHNPLFLQLGRLFMIIRDDFSRMGLGMDWKI